MSNKNDTSLLGYPNSVIVNDTNLPSGIIYKNRALLRNHRCWHKFIVSNTDGLTRNEVLKAILDQVHLLDLIPVFYEKDPRSSSSSFLARNCEAAIEKLCKDNLIVDHPWNKTVNSNTYTPFKLTIILNFANTNDKKIDVQKNVTSVLQKRSNFSLKTLDLSNFKDDPDLTEFCPLSQPKIMYFVLHVAKTLNPETIDLSNNEISLLNPLDVFAGSKLKSLDLSMNKISLIDDLKYLKHFNLKELNLEGNPFCEGCDDHAYVSTIKKICPSIEFLDKVPLTQRLSYLPLTRRTFLCNEFSSDLANHFLEYFFTAFDAKSQIGLEGIYDKNAMFSLTTLYWPNQLSSKKAQLKSYNVYARNLLKSADLSRNAQFLFRGRSAITHLYLKNFPFTEHDPYSFTTDLIYYSGTCAFLCVNGIFRELPNSLLDSERLLGFTRSFVLKINDFTGECVIINELLHVYNALTHQETAAFKDVKEPVIGKDLMPKPKTPSDFSTLVTTMATLTNLKEDWARKCLEEVNYDLKRCLEIFVDWYKADRFPRNAFLE